MQSRPFLLVTINAVCCQTNIATQIIEQEGDDVFGLKGNQALLHKEVKTCFLEAESSNIKDTPHSFFEEFEKSHGRSDLRKYWV